ncbi:812_t:CDS:2 [Entrophospora sp. SA101]|nr:812_t:CDS:2 [Entrophospora sp. SA101]
MADNEINDSCSGFFDFRDNEESSFESQSLCMEIFKKTENEKAQCIIPIIKNGKEEPCNASYKFTGSTSNMKYHLNVMHNKTEDKEKKVNIIFDKRILFISNIFNFKIKLILSEQKIQQPTISSMFSRVIPHGKSQQHKLNVALLEFIITDSFCKKKFKIYEYMTMR